MAGFPASRDTAALNELYTNTFEDYDPNIMDLTAKNSPLLYASQPDWLDFYTTKPIAHHTISAVLDTQEPESIPWDGESSVTVNAARTPRGAYWSPANYQHGAAITWREMMESRDPFEVHDILETRIYQAYKRSVETLGRDMWKGNAANALRVLGLHQGIYPKKAVNADGTTAQDGSESVLTFAKWQFRQANNSYAGVTRTPFTADGVGGSNWENLSVSMDDDLNGLSTAVFALSSGVPNGVYTFFDYFYEMCAEGLDYPDLVVMTRKPYADYKAGLTNFIRYSRTDTEKRGTNFAIDNLMFHQAVVIVDDNAKYTATVPGDVQTGSTGDNVHFINTGNGMYLELAADPAANFARSDFYSDSDTPLNSKCLVVWRGMNRVLGPHRQGVWFDYGHG